MSFAQPNLIHVEEACTAPLHATSANIHVAIRGQSFFTGTEAFKKAAELRTLLEELAKCGIPQEKVNLIAVSAQSSSGLITKSSSVEYNIEIECPSMGNLGPAMTTIASQKNAELSVIEWRYFEYDKIKRDILNQCVSNAKTRAEELCRSLGASLQAAHKLSYKFSDVTMQSFGNRRQGAFRDRGKAILAAESLTELNLAHVSELTVKAEVDFIISDFSP